MKTLGGANAAGDIYYQRVRLGDGTDVFVSAPLGVDMRPEVVALAAKLCAEAWIRENGGEQS